MYEIIILINALIGGLVGAYLGDMSLIKQGKRKTFDHGFNLMASLIVASILMVIL